MTESSDRPPTLSDELYFKSGFLTGIMYAQRRHRPDWYETARRMTYTAFPVFLAGEDLNELWQALSRISDRRAPDPAAGLPDA